MNVPVEREDKSIAITAALHRTLACAVCDAPYGSRTHQDVCMAGVSAERCVCPPGGHLLDCVEVVGERDEEPS